MLNVTEVFVHASDKKPGQQWIEVYNAGSDSLNLRGMWVKRLDGKGKVEAWRFQIPEQDAFVQPGEYALIAQKRDLGRNLCSDILVIEAPPKRMSFKSSGIQTVCVGDACAVIGDSRKVEFDRSRDLSEGAWQSASCEIAPQFFASPGLSASFCEEQQESPWHECPPQVEPEKSSRRELTTGCSQGGTQDTSWFLLLWGLLAWHMRLHDKLKKAVYCYNNRSNDCSRR